MLEFEVQFELSVENASRFLIEIDGLLVPFYVNDSGIRFKSLNSAIIHFHWVEDKMYAHRMVGSTVWLFASEIIDQVNDFNVFDLKHYTLFDRERGKIGEIIDIEDYSGNVVLKVDYLNNELLIPYNDELLVSCDIHKKNITLDLPGGLIDE